MPSFSTFIRKPGKVAAPKKIPQRRLPPKSSAPASEPETEPVSLDSSKETPATENHSNGLPAVHHAAEAIEQEVENGSTQQSVNSNHENRILSDDPPSQGQQTQSTILQSQSSSIPLTTETNVPVPRRALRPTSNPPTTTQVSSNTVAEAITQQGSQSTGEAYQEEAGVNTNYPNDRTQAPKAQRTVKKNTSTSSHTPVAMTDSTQSTANNPTRSTPQSQRIASSPASTHADAFQQITSKLQSGIERFRASQTPSRAGSVVPVGDSQESGRDDNGDTVSNNRPRKRRKKNDGKSQTIQEQVAEVIAYATGNDDLTPRNRRDTPEDAEEHEIEVETVKLAELCDDHKWGKKSTREKEMAANWPEILRRRKQENEERILKAEERRSRKRKDQPPDGGTEVVIPEQAIVNGEIVAAGRVIDNRAQIVLEANDESRPVLEARDIFNRVTQDTIAPKRKLPPGQYWDEANTDLFYQGLSMFGTDFNMIANMIPSKNRRQVKLKYNMEERSNWSKVKAALNKTQAVSLDEYADMTGLTFGSVEDLYKELEEDEKRIRAEDEARRKEEGIISQAVDGDAADPNIEADIAVPSIEDQESEQPAQPASVEAQSDRARSTATTRLGSATTGGRQTVQPPGANKKKPTRKTNPNSKRGRQAANKRNNLEGIEEPLGPADQVTVPMN